MSFYQGVLRARDRIARDESTKKQQEINDYNYLRTKQQGDREDAEFKRTEENRNWLAQQADPGNIPAAALQERGMVKEAAAARKAEQDRNTQHYGAVAKMTESINDQASYDSVLETSSKLFGGLPKDFPRTYNKGFVDNLRGMLTERANKFDKDTYLDKDGNQITMMNGKQISKTPRNLLYAPQQPEREDRVEKRAEAKDRRKAEDEDRKIIQARQMFPGVSREQMLRMINKGDQSNPNPEYDPRAEEAYKIGSQKMQTRQDKDYDLFQESTAIRTESKGKQLTREAAMKYAEKLKKQGYSDQEIKQTLINAGMSPKK